MSTRTLKTRRIELGGVELAQMSDISSDALLYNEIQVPPGVQNCTLTDANSALTAGTITAADEDHGITNGLSIDLYWTVGGIDYARRAVVVGTVDGADIPFSGGQGDTLPPLTTLIVPSKRLLLTNMVFAGDQVSSLAVLNGVAQGTVMFAYNGMGPSFSHTQRLTAGRLFSWDVASGDLSPIGNPTINRIYLSHSNSETQTITIAIQYDND